MCFQCLGRYHTVKQCKSSYKYRTCKSNHHSLTYIEKSSEEKNTDAPLDETTEGTKTTRNSRIYDSQLTETMLIVPITIKTSSGRQIETIVMIDPGSSKLSLQIKICEILQARCIYNQRP